MGWIIIFVWLLIAVLLCMLGKACENKLFIVIGAVLLLMASMICGVAS